jgi:ABC-type transport system involved in cytochrome c biogenesis permease subunit
MQLDSLPAKFRPKKAKIDQELHYNEFAPYNKGWKLMILGAIIALVAIFVRKKWADVVTTVAMFGGCGVLTYGIYLRWQIAGRIPASNMFESLLFLSWGAALFTIIGPILLKNRVVTLTSAVIAGVSLMLADVLPISSYIKPVSPVLLDTFWMAVHVPVIMISYSVLAIAVLVAHVQIIGEGIMGKRWKYAETTDTMLYWYVISGSLLLLIGILTGSMWAASGWGRYWGWDPKEVWSLVAFLGYMAILHTRVSRQKVTMPLKLASVTLISAVFVICVTQLNISGETKKILVACGTFGGTAVAMVYFLLANSRFATAAKSIIAFWLIIMTYVGVNYVLGTGLHSYGFGVGNVASKTMLVGGIDLAILGVCAVVFYYRACTAKETDSAN